jgi:hypothetical protein
MALWPTIQIVGISISRSLNKLIASFLTDRKFKILVECEFSMQRKIAAGVSRGSVLAPVLYSLYISYSPTTLGTHLAPFADDACTYATEKHARLVLYKFQRCLTTVSYSVRDGTRRLMKGNHSRSISPEDSRSP